MPSHFTRQNPAWIPLFWLGFSSGLPLALTGGTLQAWFTDAGVDIKTIGFLALVGLPYTFKFLWAPLLDRFQFPIGGRRRNWIGFTQVLLVLLIIGLVFFSPQTTPFYIALFVVLIAFVSASQDMAFDAYRTEYLDEKTRGFGNALSVTGYRIAMLVSGGLTLIVADYWGWKIAFLCLAILMLLCLLATRFTPALSDLAETPQAMKGAIIQPLRDFLLKPYALWILGFIILYKLGDAFSSSLITTFLMRGLQVSLAEVGVINKTVSLLATLLGLLAGGLWLPKLGIYRALLLFGVLQAFSNLGFMILAGFGKNLALISAVLFLENFSGGLGTIALLSFMMGLCNPAYAATQFALLSAATAIGRVYVGPVSGWLVEQIGWSQFYFWTFWIAWPGLIILWFFKERFLGAAPKFVALQTG